MVIAFYHHGPEGVRAGKARIIPRSATHASQYIQKRSESCGGLFILYVGPEGPDLKRFQKKRLERFLTW